MRGFKKDDAISVINDIFFSIFCSREQRLECTLTEKYTETTYLLNHDTTKGVADEDERSSFVIGNGRISGRARSRD